MHEEWQDSRTRSGEDSHKVLASTLQLATLEKRPGRCLSTNLTELNSNSSKRSQRQSIPHPHTPRLSGAATSSQGIQPQERSGEILLHVADSGGKTKTRTHFRTVSSRYNSFVLLYHSCYYFERVTETRQINEIPMCAS